MNWFRKRRISINKHSARCAFKFTIKKEGEGKKIEEIKYGNEKINGWFINHDQLLKGNELLIKTTE